jgi:hypothetical protein
MITIKKIAVGFTIVAVFCLSALGNDSTPPKRDGRRHGPPPEAFEVCEDKNEGDAVEIVTDRGDTISGTCEKMGDQLALRPDNPPPIENRE